MNEKFEVPEGEHETTGAVRSLQKTVTAIQGNLDRAVEVLTQIERKLGA